MLGRRPNPAGRRDVAGQLRLSRNLESSAGNNRIVCNPTDVARRWIVTDHVRRPFADFSGWRTWLTVAVNKTSVGIGRVCRDA